MRRWFTCGMVTVAAVALSAQSPEQEAARKFVLDRAKSLELNTPYVPPPGDPLTHHASGYAKVLCSAVFITGLDSADAAENVGYFTAPYAERRKMTYKVDLAAKAVHVTLPDARASACADCQTDS